MSNVTDKQYDFILSLATKVQGTPVEHLDQIDPAETGVSLSQRECRGGLSKARASEIIDTLKAKLSNA